MATRPDPSRTPPGATQWARRTRLLIVDDSLVARTVLSRLLEAEPDFEVAGVAGTAGQALALLDGTRVDVILLDVEMPGVDGLTALPDILLRGAGARVLIVSSAAGQGAEATVRALALGAADTLLKPSAGDFAGRFASDLVERLRRIGAGARPATLAGVPSETPRDATLPAAAPIGCLAIGASTGGVNALADFFGALPPSFAAPILVTQHLPAVFIPYFAAQLQEMAGRPARMAAPGSPVLPGAILVAPGDGHLRVSRGITGLRVAIDRSACPSGCMPSVDPMLASVGQVFGAAGVGVVLSGMGRDGAIGAAALVAAGGEVLAQDAGSSVVWGMPGAVANAGLAAAVLPPARLARRVAQRAGETHWI